MSFKEITYVSSGEFGGVNTIVLNLLNGRDQKDEIKYRYIGLNGSRNGSFFCQLKVDSKDIVEFDQKDNFYSVARRFKDRINNENEIIVANDGVEIRFINALKIKNPLVYIVHGDFEHYYRLIELYHKTLDKIICYSKCIYQKVKAILPSDDQRKVVLHYYPVENISNFKKKREQFLKLTFVGSLEQRKGAHHLPEICMLLDRSEIAYQLNIIGDGPLSKQLKAEIGDKRTVKIRGQLPLNGVFEELCDSDIIIFTSYAEGLPNVVVEAMKRKVVPISFNIPSGIPDLIINGETGYVVRVGDTHALVDHIINLSNNLTFLNSIAEKAKKHVDLLFDEKKQALIYEQEILGTSIANKKFEAKIGGRYLDQYFIPNRLVRFIRSYTNLI